MTQEEIAEKLSKHKKWTGETCKHCGRDQRLIWSVSDEIWGNVPQQYRNLTLCLECFIVLVPDVRFIDIKIKGFIR